MKITIAQISTPAGDIDGNTQRILDAAIHAASNRVDVLITPEMALTGYPLDDLLGDPDFLQETFNKINYLKDNLPPQLTTIIGTPFPINEISQFDINNIPKVYQPKLDSTQRTLVNSAVVIHNNTITNVIAKQLLPTYGVFDDSRWFAQGVADQPLIKVDNTVCGILICEDVWADTPITHLVENGAQNVFVINASPYYKGKQEKRETLIRKHAERLNVPIVYVNAVGGQDEVVYDGGSFIIEPHRAVSRFPFFLDAIATQTIAQPKNLFKELYSQQTTNTVRVSPLPSTEELTYLALKKGLKDYVKMTGFTDIIVGLSGGLDSALAATIAVDALGYSHVWGIGMPGPYSSEHSVQDAKRLANNLKIRFDILPITQTYKDEHDLLSEKDLLSGPGRKVAEENIQARLRALHLMTLANTHNLLLLNTGNKSETSVGYFTLGGDSSGGFAILKDVYKTKAYHLAKWRNTYAEVHNEIPPIPIHTITKPPSAELAPDQEDTDSLPPYPILDTILTMFIENRTPRNVIASHIFNTFTNEITTLAKAEQLVLRVTMMVTRAEHKRRQVAPGVKISQKAYGRDRRFPIANLWIPKI